MTVIIRILFFNTKKRDCKKLYVNFFIIEILQLIFQLAYYYSNIVILIVKTIRKNKMIDKN